MTPLTVPSPVATPAAVETDGFLTELGAQEFRVRARKGRSDIQSDMEASGENRDLRLQLAEERHARLELAKVVDGRKRGQEPRGVLPCVSALRLVARDRADTHFLNRMWHATYLVYS
ncbi:hypothetical protein Tco_0171859, partial [Tanacetum coccineum]